ncbi:hypothetical protein A7U60_g3879 [Sanghuangporus baumii]|uniref:MRG-binding protein n=1 Tax=Sanghuangporus baumii TaxID=108892 RepID=A0A9Q5NCS0_SANBA|nr:hypothetical protein A7U60_g3879 [Sanghuangporus baumii]
MHPKLEDWEAPRDFNTSFMEVISTPSSTGDVLDGGKSQNVLDTVEGEIHFFRSLMRARPVGVNRHFHVLNMQAAIEKGVKQTVPIEDIWRKLEEYYNLEALESLEAEYEQNASTPEDSSTPPPAASPKEGDNLAIHPFFREEFSIPHDAFIESVLAERRVRTTASPMSTASPVPPRSPSEVPTRRGRKRKASAEPSKVDLAGLVSGDSDSSDLTQQEEEEVEGEAQTPSERRATSAATGTDVGSEAMEEDEEEKDEDEAPRRRRGRKPARGRGRGTRKRKR